MRRSGRILDLVRQMRRRIRAGIWPPGTRIPTRGELAAEAAAAPATMQEAIARLVAEGSLTTRKRGGSRVAGQPPELHRIEVLLPDDDPRRRGGNLFRNALREACERISASSGFRLVARDGLDGAVLRRAAGQGLAGVVLADGERHAAAIAGCGVPVAAISPPDLRLAGLGIACVSMDNAALVATGIAELRRRGRADLAVIATSGALDGALGSIRRLHPLPHALARCRALGAQLRDHWLQIVDPRDPRAAAQAARALLAAKPAPRALLLLDDHLLAPVRAAVADRDVLIAVQASRPLRDPGAIAIGSSAEALLRTCVEACVRSGPPTSAPGRAVVRVPVVVFARP